MDLRWTQVFWLRQIRSQNGIQLFGVYVVDLLASTLYLPREISL
jgi:hypothetical protein